MKKFKTLFEASDPDKIAQSAMEEYKNMFRSQSPTQPESIAEYGTAGSSRGLAIVLEEEEESGTIPVGRRQTQGGEGRSQALKRKANVDEDGDIEMGEEEGVKNNKRRAVEGVDAVESTQGTRARTKPPSSSSKSSILKPTSSKTQAPKSHSSRPNSTAATTTTTTTTTDTNRAGSTKPTGAEPGKPDKDAAFLKAVASTKRGKKHEDAFDREFNNLRISKPDLDKEDELKRKQREYAILNDFGGEEDMRGNFMVVVEMEVPERREGGFRRGGGEGVRNDWIGRPDFKKFKKVCGVL